MHESEKWKWSRSVVSDSSWPHGLQPIRLLRPWDFLGKSTGVGCHGLLWETILYYKTKWNSLKPKTKKHEVEDKLEEQTFAGIYSSKYDSESTRPSTGKLSYSYKHSKGFECVSHTILLILSVQKYSLYLIGDVFL